MTVLRVALLLLLVGSAACRSSALRSVPDAANRWRAVRAGVAERVARERLDAGDLAGARAELETALVRDQENARIHALLAGVATAEGRYAEAEAALAHAEALQSGLAAIHLARGELAEARGRWGAAADAYGAAARRMPDDAAPVVAQVRALRAAGRTGEIAPVLRRARGRLPVSVDLLHATGEDALAKDELEAAVSYFQQALTLQPDHVPARCGRGLALHRLGRHRAAVEALRGAMDDPCPRRFRLALARSALLVGEVALAVETLRAHLDVDARDPDVWFEMARAHYLADRLPESLEALRRALGLRPRFFEAVALLAHVRFRERDWAQALEAYETAVRFGADASVLKPMMDAARARVGR